MECKHIEPVNCSEGEEPSPKRLRPGEKSRSLLDPWELRRAILHSLNEPMVFKGYVTHSADVIGASDDNGASSDGSGDRDGDGNWREWPCMSWDLDDWKQVLKGFELSFRIGPRTPTTNSLPAPQWEHECQKCMMPFDHFVDWFQRMICITTSSGREVNCDTHWAYFDYYHIREHEWKKVLDEAIKWASFGFPEIGVEKSTLWIGSAGANTPCHMDTYGCNIVVQVKGRKRWVLFPNSQSKLLSATRVPYEESSVYSSAGFPRPSLRSHPELAATTPYVVTLEPGDALFVPWHWWHSVENLDFAVSINTWIDLPSDDTERVKEGLVMYQVGSLCQGVNSVDVLKSVFNPNMIKAVTMCSSSLLDLLMSRVFSNNHGSANGAEGHEDTNEDTSAGHNKWQDTEWLGRHGITKVPSMTFAQYQRAVLGVEGPEHSVEVLSSPETEYFSNLTLLLNTFTDKRVIDVMKMVLDEKIEARDLWDSAQAAAISGD